MLSTSLKLLKTSCAFTFVIITYDFHSNTTTSINSNFLIKSFRETAICFFRFFYFKNFITDISNICRSTLPSTIHCNTWFHFLPFHPLSKSGCLLRLKWNFSLISMYLFKEYISFFFWSHYHFKDFQTYTPRINLLPISSLTFPSTPKPFSLICFKLLI